jgi:sugar phosphate isomerase/epimerase
MKHNFLDGKLVILVLIFSIIGFTSCKSNKEKKEEIAGQEKSTQKETLFFKISLAQWSLHKAVNDEGADPFDFAKDAKALGFEAVEYVNQLYEKQVDSMGLDAVLERIKSESEKHGVENVLIMVDHEPDLAAADPDVRNNAVEAHKKWVDAAVYLGCHSIRVNTFGTMDPDIWVEAVKDGLTKLSEYAATKNINVLVENHGWLSSDAVRVMQVINEMNLPNCGTLPDFGNWCIRRSENYFGGECLEEFPDKYEGIRLMMPAAKAVSAKSYAFDENGNETTIDFVKMLQIVKDAGYTGYIGVEYEGNNLSEKEGIIATKKLLINSAKQLN